jgi:metal-responsive CopG/Arc/MetJ family transcriptional regulator
MGKAKIAITLDERTVKKVDGLVKRHIYPNRSQAIQEALSDKIERIEHRRLARECAKLDPAFEKAMAEEGISKELDEWPEY